MMALCAEVVTALQGKTLAVAESCTGGGIGAAITAVPGSSSVFCGGVISYSDRVKRELLQVCAGDLAQYGAVSHPVARQMARGVRALTGAQIAVSVTGLAGPEGDGSGQPVGTVYVGYADDSCCISRQFHFEGDRELVRQQATAAALSLILEHNR